MSDQWQACIVDRDGFVLSEELFLLWIEATNAGKTGWGIPCEDPESIVIVRGTAAPVPQSDNPDEEFYRLPASWLSSDRLIGADLDDKEPDEMHLLWHQLRRAAEGMNRPPTPQ